MNRGQQSTLPPQLSYHRYDNWLVAIAACGID
jgi:hypothetical protein